MATTIQIKRGTGSAVPTGLADGELAINLDSGKLFFGSGSNSINSFRFENLTAENYIVSSSVTNIITQTLSGSTAFGDSADDTHQFIGNITASGNISASGTIIAATLDAAAVSDTLAAAIVAEIDNDEIPIAKLAEDAVTVTAGTGLTGGGSITLGGSATVNVIGGTGITANANDIAIGQDVATTANVQFANITSSANISASGTIHGSDLTLEKPLEDSTFLTLMNSNISGDVQNQKSFVEFSFVDSNANNYPQVKIGAHVGNNDGNASTQTEEGQGAFVVYTNDSPNTTAGEDNTEERLRVDFAGNVGIGEATPTAKLDVAGNINSTSHITASGDIKATGDITLGSNLIHDGDTDTKIAFTDNAVQIDAGGTTVFRSSVTGSVLLNTHQNIFDTGSLALSGDGGAIGDIVKFGGLTTVAGGIYALTGSDWSMASATSTATGATSSLAVALGTDPASDGMCLRGFINPFSDPGAPLGNPLFLNTTVGRFSSDAPSSTNNVVRILGYQYGTDLIYFNPSNDFIVHS